MKHTFTTSDLHRLTDTELSALFRMVADLAGTEPQGSNERRKRCASLKRIGAEISRRRAQRPPPGPGL